MPSPSTLRITVLILPPIQLLDLSPIDLFHMLSRQYLKDCNLPAPFLALGLDAVTIQYVAEHGPSTAATASSPAVLAEMTANAALRVTHSLTSDAVQPGSVDIVLVPGPDPSLMPSEEVKAWIRKHAAHGTTLMSVCTGIIPLARAGVLEGRACTGPRALLGMGLRRDFPRAKWSELRWEVDRVGGKGELWTAGGITNGQDMVAAWLREKMDARLAELVCRMADVGGRTREYGNSPAAEGLGWGWLLLRSWVAGLFGRKVSAGDGVKVE